MHWDREFQTPIVLARGRQLVTLGDAARYITSLPRCEQSAEHWRPAATLLTLFGEPGSCMLLARIAVMYGLRKGAADAPAIEPRRKRARVYTVIR